MKLLNALLIIFSVVALTGMVHAQSAITVSSYNVDPSPVSPGGNFTLYGYVTNGSSVPIDNVTFTLKLGGDSADTSYPFALEPTDTYTRNLGTIPGFTTVQVKYVISVDPAALDGDYTLTLKAASAQSQVGGILHATVNIAARAPVISILSSFPSDAPIGSTTAIQLTLKNTGSSRARDIQVGLAEDRTVTAAGTVIERDIIPLGASTVFVSALDAGQTTVVTLPVQINPSASSKAYFIPVDITFYDSADAKNTVSTAIGLKVTGDPILDAYVSDVTPLVSPGAKSRITIDLYNSGLGPAKFVTVEAGSLDFYSANQTQYFIGTIESDDFDSVILNGVVSASAKPGMHSIPLTIHLKNQFGEVKTIQKDLSIKVYSPSEVSQENGGGFPLPLLFGVIVVGGLIWWFRFRKPKNGNGKR